MAFDSIEDLAATLERSAELSAFREALHEARERCPALEPWLRAHAADIVPYLDEWRTLVAVCVYFDENPRPRCYTRQVPVGSTKFIEQHAGILRTMLDVILGDRINAAGKTFADRFHLLVESPRVRFRFLDPELRASVAWPVQDCSVPVEEFAGLAWHVPRVIVVENRDVFLCLPTVPKTLAIFGAGKAASLLPACQWLHHADVVYWGDCDEAGYGILSALRSIFPQVRSLLMDDTTWQRWKHLAVPGARDITAQHSHLTDTERIALAAVSAGPWMLEQERIPTTEAERALMEALG